MIRAQRKLKELSPKSQAYKKWAERNKSYLRKQGVKWRSRHADRLDNLKQEPCFDCGLKYPPYVMDFDHVRGEKKFNVGHIRYHSLEKLLEEISKCELVCSNCHRERTHQRKMAKAAKAIE